MIDLDTATKVGNLFLVIYPFLEKITKEIVQKSRTKNKANEAAEEVRIRSVFQDYIRSAIASNSYVKTFLYKQSPKELESIYVNTMVRINGDSINCSINELIKQGHKLIITGTGGIGKSMLFKHLFIECVQLGEFIPILVELRSLNNFERIDNTTIEDLVLSTLNNQRCGLSIEQFKYSLDMGCFIFLLDGFDEIKSSIAEKITRLLLDFCNKYSNNYFILSSRPIGYKFIGWQDFRELQVRPLNKSQAIELITKLDYDSNVKQVFLEELNRNLYKKYTTFASNPLLLTIMLITFDAQAGIPEKLNDFFEQAFLTLFQAHDATKGTYKREILSQLGYEEFKTILSYFSFQTFFSSEFEFPYSRLNEVLEKGKLKLLNIKPFITDDYINDLINSVCMLVQEGLKYKFSHRSFQEYFAALYTTRLTDSEQKQLVIKWLKEGELVYFKHSYLRMLFDLQPKRFIINVMYKGLQELWNVYTKLNKDQFQLLRYIYSDVMLCKSSSREFHLMVSIKSSFLYTILLLCPQVFPPDVEGKETNSSIQTFAESLSVAVVVKIILILLPLLDSESKQKVQDCLSSLTGQINYALSCVERCSIVNKTEKRSMNALVREL